ncbi:MULTISPECIES: 5,6-dimethylbenzimidazole synthase [unclassified Ectothiorhodospira]|uniref:5,6-dimethylbenzimidazole synthase n=1 Tax=unclassified Ectothiorhodospira TaxID=2684909 RepID=UPI001EE90196|nr:MULTISPECIES: 5,6-dimethylbenzimidazole synthase [unclassified Ectothiorhodospira]MCG5515570.1 5,6-dimethylbenzimidazole synthase [Ectothiorhodospira sp. 9100]MCG5518729.1 5,6-dimethylbenzimidazole synthase [Ectothiorhodospira sp. 9905]
MQAGDSNHEPHRFTQAEREAIYRNMLCRRDVRGQFLPDPVPDDMLARILTAAHFAPSVGYMQPWSFVVVKDPQIKDRAHQAFTRANEEAAGMFEGEKQETYRSLRLEGILDAPINLCITCDRERAGPVVIGRTHDHRMDLYSVVCAVQNLWLAARSEGLGVGWVSIFRPEDIREVLNLPDEIVPVAYLCIGRVSHFHDKPELEAAGWRPRLPLEQLIHMDGWGHAPAPNDDLVKAVRACQAKATRSEVPL